MRFVAGFLALTGAVWAQAHWRYVPGDAATIIAMEWKRVLDSPYRELFRREIPPAGAPLLGGINFIEGIERVVVAATGKTSLIVLQGKFDAAQLRSMATSDGATEKPYKNATLLIASEEGDGTEMALIGDQIVLLGDRTSLMAAVDRETAKRAQPSIQADLWVMEMHPNRDVERLDLSMYLRGGIQIDSRIVTASDELAQRVTSNARAFDLISMQHGREVRITGAFSPQEFQKRAGQWRATLSQLPALAAAPEQPAGPMKVKIYGLDSGTREVTLTPSK